MSVEMERIRVGFFECLNPCGGEERNLQALPVQAPALDALYPDFLSPRRSRSPCEGAGGSVQEARPPSPE